jgi:hypothetical protein
VSFFGPDKTTGIYDLNRICDLPEVALLTDEEVSGVSDYMIVDTQRAKGFSLLPEQANMVAQFINYEGLFGCAAAGAGKTLTAQLIANIAFRGDYTKPYKKILYLLPSNLIPQLKTSITWARRRIHFTVPFYYFDDYNPNDRETLSKTAGDGVYVLGYGMLSGKTTEGMIHNVSPDLIIADECHTLTNRKSARTRRVMHYLKKNPYTALCLLSGTIVRKTILEYHHLISLALKNNSPVPMPWPEAQHLSTALTNPDGMIPSMEIRMSRPLAEWAGETWAMRPSDNIDVLRRAYNKRLRTAPGVFISEDDKVATSLYMDLIRSKTQGTYGYKELVEMVKNVEESWVTPAGDEFEYVLQKFKWVNELWQGFYNDLIWPEDHPLVNEAKHAHDLSNILAKEMRSFLGSRHRPNLDTPLLVRRDMSIHGVNNVPPSLFKAWMDWKEANIEGLPKRLSVPVRVSDFKVQAALIAWKKIEDKEEGGIVWYYNNAFGKWLLEVFTEEYGDRVLYAPAGTKYKEAAVNSSGKIIIASIEAHGTGTDGLQRKYHNNLVAQDLRTAKTAEQTIARTHRHGQEEDEMVFHILIASKYDDLQLSGILNNSYFIHTTHTRQRLLSADWITKPKQFKLEVLREAGVNILKDITQKQITELEEEI